MNLAKVLALVTAALCWQQIGSAQPALTIMQHIARQKRANQRVPAQTISDKSGQLGAGDYIRTINSGGRRRWFEIHVPHVASGPLPVVLVLHGGAGNPDQQRFDS